MSIIDKILNKLKTELNKPEKLDEITQSIIEPIVLNCIKSLYPDVSIYNNIIICINI